VALGAVALAALTTLAAPGTPALALDRRAGDSVVVPATETIDDDLVATGRSVRIDGRVRGDVYAFAKTVTVGGVIEGDLITAASQVVLLGQVQGSVRAAGASVQLNGTVGRNVTGAAELLQVGSGGKVVGNVVGAGNTLAIGGDVGGSLAGAGDAVDLQGNVGRGAELALSSLTLGPDARIGGKLTYYADHQLNIPPGAAAGGVQYIPVQHNRPEQSRPPQRLQALGNFLSLAWLAGSAIVGLILLRLFPRFAAEFLGALETQPLPSLGVGALALIGTLPVAFLIGLTVVGIPVSLLMVAGYFSGMFIGWLFLALATGSILIGLVRKGHPWHHSWAFLLGLLVLYVATRIPVLGVLVTFIGLSLGLGAFLFTLYRTWRHNSALIPPGSPGAPAGPGGQGGIGLGGPAPRGIPEPL
jgi:hypothetical protein